MQDKEYINFINGNFSNENHFKFDSLWVGLIYAFDSIADFVPQIKFQSAVVQRETAVNEDKNFYIKISKLRDDFKRI